MLLTGSVLMLNLAFMFGKIMVGKALWLYKLKGHHHSHGDLFDRADDLSYDPYSSAAYGQQAFSTQFPGHNYNSISPYFISPPQQFPTSHGYFPPAILPSYHNNLNKQFNSNSLLERSLSKSEMDKLLTDTLARLSPKNLNSITPVERPQQRSSSQRSFNRKYINLLRPFS